MITEKSAARISLSRILLRAGVLFVFAHLAVMPGVLTAAWPLSFDVGLSLWEEVMLWHYLPFVLGLVLIFEIYEFRMVFKEPRLVIFGTIAGALLYAVALASIDVPTTSLTLGLTSSIAAFRLNSTWLRLLETSVALVFLMQRDVSRGAEAQLHQHALQWRLARRRADEVIARTALMRLEPEVLFATMRKARSTFPVDPERADASLEALTTYLRAVLQTSKAGQATFGDEVDLAAARLGLSDFAENVALAVQAEPGVRSRRIPVGALPQFLYRWAEALNSSGSTTAIVHVSASLVDDDLLVRFEGPALPAENILEPCLLQLGAAAGRAPADAIRFHGRGSFTLNFGNPNDA